MEKNLISNRNWKKLNNFEEKYKKNYLRKLKPADSIRIFFDLYEFVSKFKRRPIEFNAEKIVLLSKVHKVFNKVKK